MYSIEVGGGDPHKWMAFDALIDVLLESGLNRPLVEFCRSELRRYFTNTASVRDEWRKKGRTTDGPLI